MKTFTHNGFDIAFVDEGEGEPVLLIHGFASNHVVNWVAPGWVRTLTEAGYRAIALDNRGHGASTKSYEADDYTPDRMAGDAAALVRHLGLVSAHVMGYSMGARIAAFLALREPEIVASLVFGGLGIGMTDGVGDWDPVARALLTDDPSEIRIPAARAFRDFADKTKSDRRALAACIATSRELLTEAEVGCIRQPVLVAVGTRDDIAGAPEALAALMRNAESFAIAGRDHMLAVGDRSFKKRVLEFLRAHPID